LIKFFENKSTSLQYVSYDSNKLDSYDCIYIILSERAYKSIVAETLTFGDSETGGILLGHFVNKIWYVIEAIDPGMSTVNTRSNFRYDEDYVNHQIKKVSRLYNYPLAILGIWHRHPGSLDTFSATDLTSISGHLSRSTIGLLSMLVNVDPALRMTFYYCNKNMQTIMKVPHEHGDKLIIDDIISLADFDKIQKNVGLKKEVKILHDNRLSKKRMPLLIDQDAIPAIKEALNVKL